LYLLMEKPAVFIASSVEGLEVADALNVNLDHQAHCTIWRNGTFKVGSDGLGDLIKKSSVVDFAIFVFTPDDVTNMRERVIPVARDNVVFELGLFIGALGKDRCYVVKPRGVDMHLPSDLAGVTTADFVADRPDGDTASALNAACKQIKDRIRELGAIPRTPLAATRYPGQHRANPPEYKLDAIDLRVLAECVRSHAAYTAGIRYYGIENSLSQVENVRVSLSTVKLVRLGHIEKNIAVDERDGEEFYVYRATDDGIDAFIKHEAQVLELGSERHRPLAPAPKPQRLEDMDDDIPF
jgi:hypothetical protein